jgi:hypothetical protein
VGEKALATAVSHPDPGLGFAGRAPDGATQQGVRTMWKQLKWILAGAAALMVQPGTASAHDRTSELCQRSKLSDKTQLFCDQQRFAGEPVYQIVRLAADGTVRSIHLIETATGREVVTGYPYGRKFAAPDRRDREVRMKVADLESFLDGRPTPAASEPPTPSGYANGLPVGWNPSTGITSGQCFNYTIQDPSNSKEQEDFSSQDVATSVSGQTNVSATVSGAYDGFKASDTFTYSDQWQSSSFSSNQYFNIYALWTLQPTVDTSDPLNSAGAAAVSNGTFNTLCGSEYLEAVEVGMVATMSINYGSTSESTQTDVTNQFKASFGLDSVTTAVSTANSQSNSSTSFTFSMTITGGGPDAHNDLTQAFAAKNPSGEAYYALCAAGNTEACTSFTSSLSDGATAALKDIGTDVQNLATATGNVDISFFETFPSGVAGVATITPQTASIPQTTTNDVLDPYKADLERYLTLLNEISTLNNRVSTDIAVTGSLYNKIQQSSFNPTSFLDLSTYLADLAGLYQQDRGNLFDDLGDCLLATEDNVTSVCAPIINNKITNAYDWYGSSSNNLAFFAQQNTIALQYAARFTNNNGSSWPQDVFYAFELPAWSDVNDFVLIGGKAALVSFADTPYINGGKTETEASLTFLPLEVNTDLADLTSAVVTTQGTMPPGLWFSWFGNQQGPATNDADQPPQWLGLTDICEPSFSNPCAIGYGLQTDQPDYPLSIQMSQIPGFFTE